MPTRHTVRRLVWRPPSPHAEPYFVRLPGAAEPLRTHPTFAAAEADRAAREQAEWDRRNPFRFGGPTLFYQSSLAAPQMRDWLLDHEFPDPPADADRGLADWFDTLELSAAQRAAAWRACDKVRFHDIQESVGTVYAVVEINWTNNDNAWLDADPEGGTIRRVFAGRKRAKAWADARTRARQRRDEYHDFSEFNLAGRPGFDPTEEVFPIDQTPFFEVQPVPAAEPRAGRYVVARQAFGANGGFCRDPAAEEANTGSRVPLVAFASRIAADAYRDALEAEARRAVNPFRAVDPDDAWSAYPLFDRESDDLPNGLSRDRAIAGVRKLGLHPPARHDSFDLGDWPGWWDAVAGTLTDDTIAAVWELFAGFRLFEVVDTVGGDE